MAGIPLAKLSHYQLRNLILFLFLQMIDQFELQPIAEEECECAKPSKMIGDQEQSEDEEKTIG